MKENNKDSKQEFEYEEELETIDSSSVSFKNLFKRQKKEPETLSNTKKVFSSFNLEEEKVDEPEIMKSVSEKIREKIDISNETKQFENTKFEKERLDNLKRKILNLRSDTSSTNDVSEYNKNSNIYLNYDYKIPGYDDKRVKSIDKKVRTQTQELHNKFIEIAKQNIKDPTGELPSLRNFKDLFVSNRSIDKIVDNSFKEATTEYKLNDDPFSTKEVIIKSISDYENKDLNFFKGEVTDEKTREFSLKAKGIDSSSFDFKEKTIEKDTKLEWNFNDTFVNEEINYFKNYEYPKIDLFHIKEKNSSLYITQKKHAEELKLKLEDFFKQNNFNLLIISYDLSSRVISFSVKLSISINVNELIALEETIKIHLNVKNIRIQFPIPDKSLIGIEIPFTKGELLSFHDVYVNINRSFNNNVKDKFKIFLGKDIYNRNLSIDLINNFNSLIITDSENAKRNLLNLFIASLIMQYSPQELNLILIDPKGTDLMSYHNLPHLLTPVVNNSKKAFVTLNSIITMIKERYILMMKNHVKNIDELNKKLNSNALAKIFISISEFSILSSIDANLFNKLILLIKERGISAGVFLLLATDKPNPKLLDFEFLRNVDLRLLARVDNDEVSKSVIKKTGGEKLIFDDEFIIWRKNDTAFRAQSSYISDSEIDKLIYFLEGKTAAKYQMYVEKQDVSKKYLSEHSTIIQASKIILCRKNYVSISLLRKELNISEELAKKVEDTLIYLGIVEDKKNDTDRRQLLKKGICNDKKYW